MTERRKKVVIIGAGFAGLFAARKFFGKKVDVTIIDRNNYHTFQPLLYQVGAAEIEPDQIAYPVRSVLRKKKNIDYLMAEVAGINFTKKTVSTSRGGIGYDYLIIASGSGNNFFGTKGADKFCMTLKTLDDALKLRNHILDVFERADTCDQDDERKKLLTFVVIGGGPTGVEFAGAFAELVNGPLSKDFPGIDKKEINIKVLDASSRLLGMYSEKSSEYTKTKLEQMGIEVIVNAKVKQVDEDAVHLEGHDKVKSGTILWTAGVMGVPIKSDVKLPYRRDFRIEVEKTLQLPKYEEVFVCGDMAFLEQDGRPLIMNANTAIQEGEHAAESILKILEGKKPEFFVFKDKGSMVTIGRNSAVTKLGKQELRGFVAWVAWLFIHILYLIGFRNKIFVLFSWFSDYIFFERSGRMLIRGYSGPKGAR